MRHAVLLFVGSLFVIAALPGTLSGCGDSCEDLQEICDRCTDLDYRESCDSIVVEGNQSVCDAQKTNFNASCPFVLTTSSTTTTAVGAGGGTSSAGGNGGGSATTTTTTTAGSGGSGGTAGNGGTGGTGGTAGGGGAGGN